MRVALLVLVAVAAISQGGDAVASDKPRPRAIGRSSDLVAPLVVDGVRFALYQTSPRSLAVLDFRRSRRSSHALAPGCRLSALRRAVALLNCREGDDERPFVFGLRSRRTTAVAGWTRGDVLYRLGRYWLAGQNCRSSFRFCETVYLNWRSGERRSYVFESDDDARQYDIDSPGLDEHRERRPNARFYERVGSAAVMKPASGRAELFLLRLRGSREIGRRRLSRCPRSCDEIQLSRRFVTWAEGDAAKAYVLGDHRRFSWRFPAFVSVPAGDSVRVQHVLGRVVVSVRTRLEADAAAYRLYAIRLPEA